MLQSLNNEFFQIFLQLLLPVRWQLIYKSKIRFVPKTTANTIYHCPLLFLCYLSVAHHFMTYIPCFFVSDLQYCNTRSRRTNIFVNTFIDQVRRFKNVIRGCIKDDSTIGYYSQLFFKLGFDTEPVDEWEVQQPKVRKLSRLISWYTFICSVLSYAWS